MAIPNVFIKCKIKSSVKKRGMKKWISRFVKYYRKPSNEFGWMAMSLHKKFSLLPANIKIDNGGLWTNIGNKKIILFQTNYCTATDYDKTIPMTIEDEPQILITNKEIIQLADDKIDIGDFFKKIKDEGFYHGSRNIHGNN